MYAYELGLIRMFDAVDDYRSLYQRRSPKPKIRMLRQCTLNFGVLINGCDHLQPTIHDQPPLSPNQKKCTDPQLNCGIVQFLVD